MLLKDSDIEASEHNSSNDGVKEAQGYFPIPLRLFIAKCRTHKRRARVTKMASGNISLARGIHCSNNFLFISFAQPASVYCGEYVCVCVCVCIYIQGVTGGTDQTSGGCSLC